MASGEPAPGWFRELAEATGDVFFAIRVQPDLAVEFASDTIEAHTGHPADAFVGDPELLGRIIDPRDAEQFASALAMSPGEQRRLELRWIRRDGAQLWTQIVTRCRARPDGSAVLEGTSHDITAQRLAEQALARSEERHRLLAENAWDVIWTMALDGTITYVSPSVERVRGFTPQEAMAQSLEQIHPPTSRASALAYFAELFAAIESGTSLPEFHGEHEYYRKDGSVMIGELQVIPQVDDDGTVVQILGVTRDVTNSRAAEAALRRLAITDPLTGAWNRRHAEDLITAAMSQAEATGEPLALLMLDLDHFKSINDGFGHHAGDLVLVAATDILRSRLPEDAVLARWGGEEFVVMLRDCPLARAADIAETLRGAVCATAIPPVGYVTMSVGVAVRHAGDDLDTWLRAADAAMYAAKSSGRNTVTLSGA